MAKDKSEDKLTLHERNEPSAKAPEQQTSRQNQAQQVTQEDREAARADADGTEKTKLGTAHDVPPPDDPADPAHTTRDTRTEDEHESGRKTFENPIPSEDLPPTLGQGEVSAEPSDSSKGASNPDGPHEPVKRDADA